MSDFSFSLEKGEVVALVRLKYIGKDSHIADFDWINSSPQVAKQPFWVMTAGKNSLNIRNVCGFIPAEPVYDTSISINDLLLFCANFNYEKTDWDLIQSLVDRFKIDPRQRIKTISSSQRKTFGFYPSADASPHAYFDR